jgi:hypothetical protein
LKHLPELPPKAKAIFENPTLAAPATPLPEMGGVHEAQAHGTTT